MLKNQSTPKQKRQKKLVETDPISIVLLGSAIAERSAKDPIQRLTLKVKILTRGGESVRVRRKERIEPLRERKGRIPTPLDSSFEIKSVP